MKKMKATWISLILFGVLAGGIVLTGCSGDSDDDGGGGNNTAADAGGGDD